MKFLKRYIEAFFTSDTEMKRGEKFKIRNFMIGHAIEDSVPDPDHPGYQLVKVAIASPIEFVNEKRGK